MKIAYVLLAAGNGSRFGRCKQLANVDGQAVIQHSLSSLTQVAESTPFVVLGAYQGEIEAQINAHVSVISHPQWQLGLGSSIAKAAEVIDALNEYDAIMFTLADQIKVTSDDLTKLIDSFDGKHISAAFYGTKAGVAKPGVPAIFPQLLFADLKALVGKNGAKTLLMSAQGKLNLLQMDNALFDIDYPEDIERY